MTAVSATTLFLSSDRLKYVPYPPLANSLPALAPYSDATLTDDTHRLIAAIKSALPEPKGSLNSIQATSALGAGRWDVSVTSSNSEIVYYVIRPGSVCFPGDIISTVRNIVVVYCSSHS